MAENITTLGIEVKTSGVQQAASDLQKLANSAGSAEQSTGGMASAIDRVNAQMRAMGDKAKGAGQAFKSLDTAASSMAKLGKESKHAADGVKAAANQLDKFNKEAQQASGSADGIATAMGKLSNFAGGIAVGAAIIEIVRNLKSAIDGLDKLNDQVEMLGISAEELSALNFAGVLSGVSAEEMTQGLTRLSVKMAEAAEGGNKASAVFEKLGINVHDSSGKLKSADSVLSEVADAFSQMEGGAEKTALSIELFNRGGAKFVQLLSNGSDGLKRMKDEAKALGGVIDGDLVKQSAEFNDNLDRLSTLTSSVGRSILSDLLQPLNNLIADFIRGIGAAGGFWSAMGAAATMPFGNLSTQIKSVRADLAGMEKDQKEAGYFDQQRYDRKIAQLKILQGRMADQVVAENAGTYGNEGRGVKAPGAQTNSPSADYIALTQKMSGVSADFHKHLKVLNAEYGRTGNLKNYQAEVKKLIETETQIGKDSTKKPSSGGGNRKGVGRESDEAKAYEQALKSIASAKLSAEKSTLSLTAAESALFDLQKSPVWASMPETWKQTAIEQSKAAAEYERTAMFMKAVEAQEQSNVKQRQGMIEQIQAAEKANEMYGLTASQISVVEQSRLADAIAILEQEAAIQVLNGASEEEKRVTDERIKFLKEELSLRGKLSDVLISGDVKKYDIQDATDQIKESTKELDEFTKQAAHNMQDAMADFFINPTKDGMDSLVESFGKTMQKMIVQAGSAQLMNILFGDMGKTGKIEGVFGDAIKSMKGIFASKGGAATGGAAAGVGAAGILPGEWDWLDGAMKDMRVDMKGVFDQISKSMKDVFSSISSSFSSIDFGSVASSFMGLFAANGYAFNNGQVQKFANGGAFGNGRILTQPTMFAMGGTFGVAGEAGPEGALPLKRMSNGKLGVHMSGGGGMTINQTINAGAGTDKAEVRRAAASGARSVLGVANGARRYG